MSSPQKSVTFWACTLFLLAAAALATAGACGGETEEGERVCQPGTTQACTCSSGTNGAQVCGDNTWQACVCDGTPVCQSGATQACVCPGGATGAQSCSNNTWGSCTCSEQPPQKEHGDLCTAPSYDCGNGTNLICVVDAPGDSQGICRVTCQLNTSCVEDDQSWAAGDTSCCDVGNGTSACFAPFSCD